jgi:hypothetical protein
MNRLGEVTEFSKLSARLGLDPLLVSEQYLEKLAEFW